MATKLSPSSSPHAFSHLTLSCPTAHTPPYPPTAAPPQAHRRHPTQTPPLKGPIVNPITVFRPPYRKLAPPCMPPSPSHRHQVDIQGEFIVMDDLVDMEIDDKDLEEGYIELNDLA
ncbi:uncharacterized protein A4U43_C05F32670 [Asparagus officinalis]|uniref:Uncharacterized protein n=1 Tax=Asparagus officinalis TaxID=4686 RepID=A0A5P1EW74_ASPOF|nr:uncharacterized protein A4U43_C05F32670 [Asparagus officinalis]